MFMPVYNTTWRQRFKFRIRWFFRPPFRRVVVPQFKKGLPLEDIRSILCSNSLKGEDGTQTQGIQTVDTEHDSNTFRWQ